MPELNIVNVICDIRTGTAKKDVADALGITAKELKSFCESQGFHLTATGIEPDPFSIKGMPIWQASSLVEYIERQVSDRLEGVRPRGEYLVVIHSGAHRGIWCRTDEHRQRLWAAMTGWSSIEQALAATLPVRIAANDDAWDFVVRLAGEERLFMRDRLPELLHVAPAAGPENLPEFNAPEPHPPHALLPQFATDLTEGGVRYIAADGQPAGGGVY